MVGLGEEGRSSHIFLRFGVEVLANQQDIHHLVLTPILCISLFLAFLCVEVEVQETLRGKNGCHY